MAKNYFNRYVWLIDTINRHGHISREEISRLWKRSSLNDTGEELYERTFHNHREAILDTFGIEIKCDRSLGYYIANSDDLEGDGIRQWLLESLSMNNLLNESSDMRDRILFEKIPSSQKWLPVIVNAMRDKKTVELTYQSFTRKEPSTFTAHSYCLKLFRQRWYMLARSEDYDKPRVYSLDRIIDAHQSRQGLKRPKSFDAKSFFDNYFGIIIGTDRKPCEILLKVDESQVKYFDSLPLHESQRKVEVTNEYSIYSYHFAPTFDFEQEVLSHSPFVEVISPEYFRDEIRADLQKALERYD